MVLRSSRLGAGLRGAVLRGAVRLGAVLLGAGLTACSPSEPAPEPEIPRRLLRLGSIRAQLPSAWQPVPDRALTRLREAAQGSDPDGRMEMVALGVAGPSPDFSLTIVDLSPDRSRGLSARSTVEAMERDLRAASAARGLEVTFEQRCEARHCDARYAIEGTGARQENWVRVWRRGDVIQQRRCACIGEACEELDRCELPEPPANAAPFEG